MKKRYALFAGSDYYPAGGTGDIKGFFDTAKEAKESDAWKQNDWAEIVDCDTWNEVE
jgi:hypothetical protein